MKRYPYEAKKGESRVKSGDGASSQVDMFWDLRNNHIIGLSVNDIVGRGSDVSR